MLFWAQRANLKQKQLVVLFILLLVLLLLVGILLWLMLMPMMISVNTWSDDYSIRWKSIGKASVLMKGDELLIRLRVFFWRKDFYPLRPGKKKKPAKKEEKKPEKKAKSRWERFPMRKIRGVLRAIKVRRFKLDVDTDDYVMNAYLYPVACFLNRPNREISINFRGSTNFLLQIEIQPIRVVGAIIFK